MPRSGVFAPAVVAATRKSAVPGGEGLARRVTTRQTLRPPKFGHLTMSEVGDVDC